MIRHEIQLLLRLPRGFSHTRLLPFVVACSSPLRPLSGAFLSVSAASRLYVNYAGMYMIAIERLADASKKSKKLRKFLDETRSSSGQPIQSLMITPIQRIPRYLMLSKEVCGF